MPEATAIRAFRLLIAVANFVSEPCAVVLPVDLHPDVTRVFHRELTRLSIMFCGLCWGQDMRGLPFCFGYR